VVFEQSQRVWVGGVSGDGNFALASTIEEFQMPTDMVGVVHDKSTWARKGLSVFNTVIEPGWKGFLTLELVYHGRDILAIPAGSGIAQVLFHNTAFTASYDGKYQNQADQPVEAIDG
jgi:dCTP deaminase